MENREPNEVEWEEVWALAGIGQWSEVARHCESFFTHSKYGENAVQLQA